MAGVGCSSPRIALAHHWLMSMRGGEKMLAVLADLFPEAPIFSLVAKPDQLDARLRQHELRLSWLQRFNRIPNLQRKALPLLARAARSLDATDYDLVICSDAAIIKAIRTRPDALKVCYCHTPMRYVWDLYEDYYQHSGPLARLGLRWCAGGLRRADREAAHTVDVFLANSRHVADRIRRHYGRASLVIHPPVDVAYPPPLPEHDEFYLVVSELVHYKRVDLAVDACTRLGRPLVVIGTGPLLADLRRRAGECVRLLGWQSDEVVRDHLRRCRALLFCGEEDFGLTPVEAMAAGRPVIAYKAGGATETVVEGVTGLFFNEQTPGDLAETIRGFERIDGGLSPAAMQEHARPFGVDAFRASFLKVHNWLLEQYNRNGRETREAFDRMADLAPGSGGELTLAQDAAD